MSKAFKSYTIATLDADIEAGYADYSDTGQNLIEMAQTALNYGIPANRLTVTEYWLDQSGKEQHDTIGTLEEVLHDQSKGTP